MPILPLPPFLISTLASNAVHTAAQATDAGSTKGAAAAKPSSKGKKSSDAATMENAFAACMAAATAVPPSATLPTAPTTQKAQAKSANGVPGTAVPSSAAPGSAPKTVPAAATTAKTSTTPLTATAAKRSTTPLAAAATIKKPTPPALAARNTRPAAANSTDPTVNVPAKPLSREGRGEAHLGIHTTTVDSPSPETPPLHEQATTTNSVSESGDPPRKEPLKPTEASSVAATPQEPPPATAQASTRPPGDEPRTADAVTGAANGAKSRLFAASTTSATTARSSSAQTPRLSAAPEHAKHTEAQPQAEMSLATSPGTSGATTLAVPTVAPVSQTTSAAAPTAAPVADQLARAFVAQANVVHGEGRTDFHLRLNPPQLGSVQIHLTATQHSVSARIVVAQEGTRQLLEGQAQHLREGLAEAGLSLGSFDVTHGGGGGADGGGQYTPPETPLSPPTSGSTPRSTRVVSTTVSRPTDGINILA